MGLKLAFQMDDIAAVDITADSTFRLALEAQARGHTLFFYLPQMLTWREGAVLARGSYMTVQPKKGAHVTLGPEEVVDLRDWDAVFLRQDPPFDMAYVTSTHLLEQIHPQTLVVNDPFWVRNAPEKILVTEFEDLTPPTLITRDLAMLQEFRAKHDDIVVKPLYGNGGAGVFRMTPEDKNINSLFEMFTQVWREPFIAQRFLSDVSDGDKRVILVNGEAVGAINRVPALGETRSNLHVGGRAEPVALSERDLEICARIGPMLQEKGLVFVGIDVIGPWLTEINVTSPTGIQELERFSNINAAAKILEVCEQKIAAGV